MENKFEIKMNDGTIKNVIIENYDAEEIANELNNPDKNMIAIGTGSGAVVVQRYSVIRITPIEYLEGGGDNSEQGDDE